jgi:hypothetical protein
VLHHKLKKKRKFFKLKLTNGEIEVKVLDSVEEFYREGSILNHCVFSNEYYKKQNFLAFGHHTEDYWKHY